MLRLIVFILSLVLVAPAFSKTVTFSWDDPDNPTGTSYSVICNDSVIGSTSEKTLSADMMSGKYQCHVDAILTGFDPASSIIMPASIPLFAPINFTISM